MTGEGNWTWLLPGRVPTLVDAGVGDARHLDALEEALNGKALAQVVVTHGHSDHASGVTAIRERMPHARFLKFPWLPRDDRWSVPWEPIADGDLIAAGDASLVAVHTPGHAPDHICLWHQHSRVLFGGDLAISGTTVFIPSTPDGDVAAYVASLERMLALNPVRILPAHGPVIDEPMDLLQSYVRHRRQREQEIVNAIRHGDLEPDAIVARIYTGLSEPLLARARETVIAHLRKLERDGRVGRRGDTWHIITEGSN